MTYRGVFLSLNPRKIPCMAKDRRIAGALSDRNFKSLSVGISMGELYWERERERERGKKQEQRLRGAFVYIFNKQELKLYAIMLSSTKNEDTYIFYTHHIQEWFGYKYKDYSLNEAKNCAKKYSCWCWSNMPLLPFDFSLIFVATNSFLATW